MCGCDCYISSKSIHHSLLTEHGVNIKQLRDIIQNAKNRRSGEISSYTFENYKNGVRPHVLHIYITAVDMSMKKMCPCPY